VIGGGLTLSPSGMLWVQARPLPRSLLRAAPLVNSLSSQRESFVGGRINNNNQVVPRSSIFTVPGFGNKEKKYKGKKLVGFTMEQMYDVVSDVENYKEFVPFCIKSLVKTRTPHHLLGELEIGFPPILESYTSNVTLRRPHLVKANCTDGRLFDHLVTTWAFSPGLKERPQSCVIDFYVSFQFKSLLHSQLAHMFFNELVRQMESAFVKEAQRRFGQPSFNTVRLKVNSNTT